MRPFGVEGLKKIEKIWIFELQNPITIPPAPTDCNVGQHRGNMQSIFCSVPFAASKLVVVLLNALFETFFSSFAQDISLSAWVKSPETVTVRHSQFYLRFLPLKLTAAPLPKSAGCMQYVFYFPHGIGKEQHIIHISNITFYLHLFFCIVIKKAEIKICKVLAR